MAVQAVRCRQATDPAGKPDQAGGSTACAPRAVVARALGGLDRLAHLGRGGHSVLQLDRPHQSGCCTRRRGPAVSGRRIRAHDIPAGMKSEVVTATLPRATLAEFGLPVSPIRAAEPIDAQFLIGPNGGVLAVRFVDNSNR
jgi:hypothetical protein